MACKAPYVWFAWYPVRLGALGLGPIVWMKPVLRIPSPEGCPDIFQEWNAPHPRSEAR